jgi:outer membrane protein assembly factor BamB
MKSLPILRRWLAAGATLVVLAVVLGVISLTGGSRETGRAHADQAGASSEPSWPLFGGSISRNMVNTFERNVPSEWSVEEGSTKNVKWVVDLGSKAYGGPVVAGGKVFIGTNNEKPRNPKVKGDKGILMCFRAADGQFLWQAIHDKLPAGLVNDWPREGICSTPVVEGNRLYYVSNRCEVICADTEGFLDGKNDGVQDEKYQTKTDADIIWRLDMIGELSVFPHNLAVCSPLIVGDNLFVITSNGVDEGHINIPQPKAPSFIVLNKKTGKLLWQDNSPGEKIMHGQWSNPVYAVANGRPMVVFPGGDGYLRAFEPDTGKLLWKFDCNPKNSVYKLGGKGTKSDFLATPVIYENKAYVGVGQDPEHDEGVGHFWCIDITKEPTNPDKDVSPVNDNFDPKAPENKDSALVWHFGGPGDPKKIGRNYYFGRTMSTAAIHDGLVYIAELAGYLHCLDAKTGQEYWQHNMNAATWSSPYWVDGKIYMGNDGEKILVFQDGKEKKLLNEIDMGSKVRATPVAVGGVLYVMTENQLFAIVNKN